MDWSTRKASIGGKREKKKTTEEGKKRGKNKRGNPVAFTVPSWKEKERWGGREFAPHSRPLVEEGH